MNEEIARAHVAASQKIAESIRPRLPIEEVQSRSKFRPPSPVKAIASFIGGSLKESSGSLRQRGVGASDVFTEDSTILKPSALFPPSPGPQPRGIEDPAKNQVTLISTPEANAYGSIPQLETTLMTYLVALHSRRGNVVGKVLRGRIGCDELRVNELCNALSVYTPPGC